MNQSIQKIIRTSYYEVRILYYLNTNQMSANTQDFPESVLPPYYAKTVTDMQIICNSYW